MGQWPSSSRLAQWQADDVGVGWSGNVPDSETFLALAIRRTREPESFALLDEGVRYVVRQQRALPDGPERLSLMREMKKYFVAYVPYKLHGHRIRRLDAAVGHWLRRHPFMRDFFKYIDIDTARSRRAELHAAAAVSRTPTAALTGRAVARTP